MQLSSLWITGSTRSGKTTRLVEEFSRWVRQQPLPKRAATLTPSLLVLAANNENRRTLSDRMARAVTGSYPTLCKTPLGFISDEVMLFWPLLFETLKVKAQFPLRLRPETEQDLAERLWRDRLDRVTLQSTGVKESRFVRQTLDLLQLAGASMTPTEVIPRLLALGCLGDDGEIALDANLGSVGQLRGELLLEWQQWCLDRGLLSYGTIYELYWRDLLPNPTYQGHLTRRYSAIFADDVDDYPAIARDFIELLLDRGATGTFTYNPDGKIRLGLNADPDYLSELAQRCRVELLPDALSPALSPVSLKSEIEQAIFDLVALFSLPPSIQSIQTTSRAALLRQTSETIARAIASGEIEPKEIAIIAPGLDPIARYTLLELLGSQNVPVEALNEQRPLISSPLIRALLTLLALIYPGLGRFAERDRVAEMLAILSNSTNAFPDAIDPVRAGLLADYCYRWDGEAPCLNPSTTFARWDRLGHQATTAYEALRTWVEGEKARQREKDLGAIALLDRAIEYFFAKGTTLPFEQLDPLRELIETAQHFWEVERRLRQNEPMSPATPNSVGQFIQLLRQGTITANAYPLDTLGAIEPNTVTLATIFQYRSSRRSHRWHFWLDASSHLWQMGGAATLFAAPIFLKNWLGEPRTPDDRIREERDRLARILRDLLGRAQERIYLCHSDLAVNGTEHTGPLLPLVYAARSATPSLASTP
ncbi:recombinase family protein [Lusitaniella coriacea]|uniref:recombinase family protein n=1 Tax=Lusitaniella coriacea TaxID=1983105 RepID=UPI003CF9369B